MKTKKNKIIVFFLILILLISKSIISFADFGDFESYDSGSSSWSSSSSSDYSSYGSGDSNYDLIILPGGSMGNIIFWAIVIVAIIIYNNRKNQGYRPPRNIHYEENNINVSNEEIEAKVKEVDEMFNAEEFISWAKDVFVKLQNAWMRKDYDIIRHFETIAMYEQTRQQIQAYIDNHKTNKLERICVKSAKLGNFEQSGDKDIITVVLSSKMIDYIVNDDTNEIIKGDTTTERHSAYRMTFIRKTGVKTKLGMSTVDTTNCPNCGAPTEITTSGKCEYCGSVVTTGEFNWVLSGIEKIF